MKQRDEKILLAHGSGGRLSHLLVKDIVKKFANPFLEKLDDSAVLDFKKGSKFAFTTDGYVVDPPFFPGGDIGSLAVFGTVNDLAMVGAKPRCLAASAVLEEGFPAGDFERIILSMKKAAARTGVVIVTGDTKVVDKGKVDRIFITTSGIGIVEKGINISSSNVRPGDRIIRSGAIGEHGIAVLTAREKFGIKTGVRSDCAPLNWLVARMTGVSTNIHALRDPTRGGLATTLCEIAEKSSVGMEIEESAIPVKKEVRVLCEMLGFDPLYIANEGKLVAFVPEKDAASVLRAMRGVREGASSRIIGAVVAEHRRTVLLKTKIGGNRVIDMLSGEQLPRIC